MLLLKRKDGEFIRIGDDIRIGVAVSKTGQIRLAVDAPDSVPVHREEVYQKAKARDGFITPGGRLRATPLPVEAGA